MVDSQPEIIECRKCGTEFDLAAQNYYDNLCPSCVSNENPERTWPVCIECEQKIPPYRREYKTVRGAARDPSTVKVPVHENCKEGAIGDPITMTHGDPDPDAPPYDRTWIGAMDEIEDDPDFTGVDYYELSISNPSQIYVGDQFFDVEKQYMIEVSNVKAKARANPRTGDVIRSIEDHPHYIFYDRDWEPMRVPERSHHFTDDIHYIRVDYFEDHIDVGRLVPHKGNGLTRPP